MSRGAHTVGTVPEDPVHIVCGKCERRGRYRRTTLLALFGPDESMPHVMTLLAAWAWAFMLFLNPPVLLGTAFLACMVLGCVMQSTPTTSPQSTRPPQADLKRGVAAQ